MPRWLRTIIWAAGSSVIWCPICVCLSNQGAWWVCASTIGMISATIISGYSMWTVINQLLYAKESKVQQFILSHISFTTEYNKKETFIRSFKTPDSILLEQEISSIAQTIHAHLILPWYSSISPEEKYALQVRSTVEDLLTGLFRNIQQHSNLKSMLQDIILLYIQHYHQFYKALKKVSHKLKTEPVNCLEEIEEIKACYKPRHPAYKITDGINLHCQRLSHLLLVNYLPPEVTKCSILFVSLRDLFAQKLLHSILDALCDTQWLNKTLLLFLTSHLNFTSKESLPKDLNIEQSDKISPLQPTEGEDEERVFSYIHSLSAIREETSFDLSDIESEIKLGGGKLSADLLRRLSVIGNRTVSKDMDADPENNKLVTKCSNGETSHSIETNVDITIVEPQKVKQTFQNTEDLLRYIRTSPHLQNEANESFPSVRSALGDFISTTAAPILPDTSGMFLSLQPLPTKMWISPMDEKDFLAEVIHKKNKINPFMKNIVDGIKEEDYKRIFNMISKNNEKKMKNQLNPLDSEEETELQRSKSLTSLVCDCSSLEDMDSSSKFSFSSENLNRSLSNPEETVESNRKQDKRLTKMLSFDRNDGTDEFSVSNNKLAFSKDAKELNQLKLLLESRLDATLSNRETTLKDQCKNKTDKQELGTSGISLKSSAVTSDSQLSSTEDQSEISLENPELSPIYEESENLASTIAKLRCLLSERQSQHSLGSQSSFGSSESEPKSAQSDPGRYNLEKSKFTFLHKDSAGSLASMKSNSSTDSYCPTINDDEVLEASEVPPDGRVFVNVSIPTTEVHSETAGFQYTMYIIQYDAIYLCDRTSSTTPVIEEICESSSADHKMVLQTNFVKRRFREFLTLQSALEEDSHLRLYMKGIKGPNKWLNLPFSKLDSATISSRKLFLEKYLQAIIERPSLNSSLPLKEFLAYGSDASVSFGKKSLELNVPRFDKLLARTVSGVFQSIKTALPNFDSPEVQPNGTLVTSFRNSHPLENLTKSASAKSFGSPSLLKNDFEIQLDMTAEEQNCEMEGAILEVITSSSELNSPVETALEAIESSKCLSSISFLPKLYPLKSPSYTPVNPIKFFYVGKELSIDNQIPCAEDSFTRDDNLDDSNYDCEDNKNLVLFKCFLDALVEILSSSGHPLTRQASTDLLNTLCARPVSVFIQDSIDVMTSDQSMQEIFEKIRSFIKEAFLESQEATCLLEDDDNYKKEIIDVINACIPNLVHLLLGKDHSKESVTLFVESFQHPAINQDFGLHLLDLLFVHILLPIRMNG